MTRLLRPMQLVLSSMAIGAGLFLVLQLSLNGGVTINRTGDLLSHLSPLAWLLNLLAATALVMLVRGVAVERRSGLVALLVVIAVWVLVNANKIMVIGQPVMPYDLFAVKYASLLFLYVPTMTVVLCGFIALVIATSVILSRRVKKPRDLSYRGRLGHIVFGLAVLGPLSLYQQANLKDVFSRAHVDNQIWSTFINARDNGYLLAFVMAFSCLEDVAMPPAYNRAKIEALVQAAPPDPNASDLTSSPSVKPDVVVVMLESFWDPTLLPLVTYQRDPIPFFRSFPAAQRATLAVPGVGGGTANTEFEVLTGLNLTALPPGAMPYEQYIRKPMPSLVSTLKGEGYEAYAVHNFLSTFYRRNAVYEDLGFDDFIGVEKMQLPPPSPGADWRPSDVLLYDKTLELLRAPQPRHPRFVFAVTFGSHGPWSTPVLGLDGNRVSGPLTPGDQWILGLYVGAIARADEQFHQFIEALETLPRPVEVIAFGDHLPALGDDNNVYQETGFVASKSPEAWTDAEWTKMHTTPLVSWRNAAARALKVAPDRWLTQQGTAPARCLGQHILNTASLPSPAFFRLVEHDCLSSRGALDYRARQLAADDPGSLLLFDRMFGESYSRPAGD